MYASNSGAFHRPDLNFAFPDHAYNNAFGVLSLVSLNHTVIFSQTLDLPLLPHNHSRLYIEKIFDAKCLNSESKYTPCFDYMPYSSSNLINFFRLTFGNTCVVYQFNYYLMIVDRMKDLNALHSLMIRLCHKNRSI